MLYTVKETARQLRISASYVYLLIRLKELTPARVRPYLFTEEEIERYKEANKDHDSCESQQEEK